MITNYLCRNNLPIPVNFSEIQATSIHNIQHDKFLTLNENHPFLRLKRLLYVFELTILPADKTKMLVILPKSTLEKELNLHLQDLNTYRVLSSTEHQVYVQIQRNAVIDALKYYRIPSLLPTNVSNRYIYFLPKIHKQLSDWRNIYHPKMRPIVSDTGSLTYALAKYILPKLQMIEQRFHSTIPSSLAMTATISTMNDTKPIQPSTSLVTMDVESLFTRIPQADLLQIVNKLIVNIFPSNEQRNKFIFYLESIIKYNTFQVGENFCLQQIGLPMGGPLSATLANIYLGYLEQRLIQIPKLLLYQRYMDDILLICNFSAGELLQFITQLQLVFKLSITASSNKQSVNFLDTSISILRKNQIIQISPFSKKFPFYPVPSNVTQRNFSSELNIIISQILRAWRVSTEDYGFSQSIKDFLPFISSSLHHNALRKKIFKFLSPVQVSTNKWTTSIPMCSICKRSNVKISKVLHIEGKYISVKKPINCQTQNIFILVKDQQKATLKFVLTLHNFLQSNIFRNISILPIGGINDLSVQRLLKKHPSILYSNKQTVITERSQKTIFPCHIFPVFKSTTQVYGINARFRKRTSFTTFFNDYKKISKSVNKLQ
jgi:hypothetical protein